MNSNEPSSSLLSAIEGAGRQAEELRAKFASEIADVDSEIANIEEAIAKLHEQREALVRLRAELESKSISGVEVSETYYNAIFGALQSEAAAFSARAESMKAAAAAKQEALAAAMNSPEIASLKAESEQFKADVEPTLAGLPESYRNVLLAHHQSIENQLQAHLSQLGLDSVESDEEPLTLSVVYAIEPLDGAPEVLTVVFPVYESVYADWESRQEDMCTRFATSIVQGVYRACRDAGLSEAEGMFGGHQDLLAMELDLTGASESILRTLPGVVVSTIGEQSEFMSAKIEVQMIGVDMDHLLPPEEGDENLDAGEI